MRMIRNLTLALVGMTLTLSAVSAGEIKGKIKGGAGGQVVVWVEGLQGQVPERDTPVTHVKGGAFEPGLSIGYVGRSFVFRNDDKVLHNTHLYMRMAHQKDVSGRPLQFGSTVYNVALPHSGKEVKKEIKPYHRYRDDTGFIEAVCNAHPNERAFLLVVDHPYIAVADKRGSFKIGGVPEGDHEIRYWHAGTVKSWGSVSMNGQATTSISIELE